MSCSSYPYTQLNRLEEPHNYMYTPFGGDAFLQAYRADREAVLDRIAGVADTGGEKYLETPVFAYLTAVGWGSERLSSSVSDLALSGAGVHKIAGGLSGFSIVASVNTERLLDALLDAQLSDALCGPVKTWLDRLVQRFEVTKKLYATYPPGFRKGEGANTSVRLYWLLGLSLALFYARTRHLKYLNTLLKVNDLLASLPQEMFAGHLSTGLMAVVFRIELAGVAGLTEIQGQFHAAQ
ncbi:hypothetical protein [Dechloromonas denitrificans]|uniref:hypothetical protein n=1 Tax=Dechloromonas denitrificans TaxID=281362 RepID=UPI001CFA4A5B|nr:hypothetical protein [Dechloromonas denitrificans]UCV06670.1 hypothetical protein KI615_14815 [Dechloromonas denitrificans]